MEQLLAIRDRVNLLEFKGNSVMELRLLVLSALNHIMRQHQACEEEPQRTIFKDAFRVLKYNYKFIEAAQGDDARAFRANRQKSLNGLDELLMQLCMLEARFTEGLLNMSQHQYAPQLRIA